MTPDEIHRIRERAGLTLAQLGEILGVGASTVSQWETGKRTPSEGKIAVMQQIRERLDRARSQEAARDLLLKIGGVAATAGLTVAWKKLFSDETDSE